ncbi:helix-turn-helix transcriptional regulator [Streptomyces griseorubiginosus]|uniref:helix-turn-helix domain-containing protein n=1 Tax=Streptomyces griseorubiginosus TaxID=67304 RepID=UPI002E800EAE|nr:helix-turn-helix transcriptional regulator [Streptomyces griseorubiginosus]WUB46052.1 helix-turn-helix domain-containing protein [Streptomyces griseorubiginosus]WUB54573.1 helix-turn-helix domain-containing protein [Streptomyces griseorubiginosus]
MPQRRVVTGRSHEPRARFAEELRLLRAGKGGSLRDVADRLGWDASTLGKMESGRSLGSPELVEALDQHYGTSGMLLALWELAVGDPTQFKEQYRRYMVLETEAHSLWHFGVSTVHGLLQSDGYARELLALGGAKGEELDQQVEARTGRRQLLEEEDAPVFRAVLAEAVLRTPLRDAGAWREQLEHLLEVAQWPNVTIQVLPQDAGMHGLVSSDVMFLKLLGGRTVVYLENALRGELVEEITSVERLHRAYDAMRDLALNPGESRKFILRMLEEVPCEPST